MSSSTTSAAKRTAANRRNASKSTGPKTAAGKHTVSRNATTHGLLSQTPIIVPGQEDAYRELQAGLRRDLQPSGTLQELLFENALHAAWNMRRCRQLLAQLQGQAHDPTIDILHDDDLQDRIHRVELYRRRNESSFHRALTELRALQTEAHFREATNSHRDGLSVLVNTKSIHRYLPKNQPQAADEPVDQTKPPSPGPRNVNVPPFVARQLANYFPKAG
jgi:hypothetical protein